MLKLLFLSIILDLIPMGDAYLKQLQQRDSVLVGDQIEYGFQMDAPKPGTVLELGDYTKVFNDTLVLIRNWQIDSIYTKKKLTAIRAAMILAPFEEGKYTLPEVPVRITVDDRVDTLLYRSAELEVRAIPVDTATFVIKDIKGQISYPLTFREVAPYIGGGLLLAALIAALILLIKRLIARKAGTLVEHKDPAHVVALRELDKYRGEKFWAPEKQKIFYSGITDALKVYIDERFGVDAPEMTTAELFDALKASSDITPELYTALKTLFETADFVKFAKFTADNEYNSKVLPLAVNFVTTTYEAEISHGEEKGGED